MGGAGWSALIAAGFARPVDQEWYPAPELGVKLSFQLVDPLNDNTVVIDAAGKGKGGYWLTDWLPKSSYDAYSHSRAAYIEDRVAEIAPVDLTLKWQIQFPGGPKVSGPDWKAATGDWLCQPSIGCPNFGKTLEFR